MPTYTYECRKCGRSFDVFHAMTANPRVRCTACRGGCKRRIGIGSGIIFKGSGFYETDYRKGDGKAAEKAPGGGEAKSESKTETETKSESKTETKSESKTESKSESKTETKGDTKSSKTESKSSKPAKE